MRRSAPEGAFGSQAQPAVAPPEVAASKGKKRGGNRGRGSQTAVARRGLEAAVQERKDIRNERNPLARRHLPEDLRHIDPELLPAKDFTRGTRVAAVTVDVDAAYRIKRGAAR